MTIEITHWHPAWYRGGGISMPFTQLMQRNGRRMGEPGGTRAGGEPDNAGLKRVLAA